MNPDPAAPLQLTVNHAWQWGFGSAHFLIALFVIAWAAKTPLRTRNWAELRLRMLVLLGGALGAPLFEGAVDRAGNLWYARAGQWKMDALFGVHVPLWVAPVYLWFAGGFALWIIDRVRNGAGRATFVKVACTLIVADLGLEIPIVRLAKLYVYYGHTQPLFNANWFPLPAWYITTNMFFVMLPALLVLGVMSTRIRHIELSIPLVMVAACYMTYGSVAWPVIAALHNGFSKTGTTLAALLTMVLGLLAVWISANVLPKLRGALDWYGGPAVADAPLPDNRTPNPAQEPVPAGTA